MYAPSLASKIVVTCIKGTKAKEVTDVLKKMPEAVRQLVEEVTLDFSDSMHQIVSACFPKQSHDKILNYFVNRSTNASEKSLNAKIKDFRAQLRGVIDKKFFIFRLVKIFG